MRRKLRKFYTYGFGECPTLAVRRAVHAWHRRADRLLARVSWFQNRPRRVLCGLIGLAKNSGSKRFLLG